MTGMRRPFDPHVEADWIVTPERPGLEVETIRAATARDAAAIYARRVADAAMARGDTVDGYLALEVALPQRGATRFTAWISTAPRIDIVGRPA